MNKDDKIKILIYAIITFVVILMIVYTTVVFGGGKNKENGSRKISFAVPKLEQKTYEYNKRLDLINAKGYPPVAPKKIEKDESLEEKKLKKEHNPFMKVSGEGEPDSAPIKKQTNLSPGTTQGVEKNPTVLRQHSHKNMVTTVPDLPHQRDSIKRRKERHLSSDSTNKITSRLHVSESIPCKIYGDHRVTNYSKISVRITRDVVIDHVEIKRNTIITGIVQLTQSKVNIRFETIQYKQRAIATNMKAYSRDGLEGIYIEGGIEDDVRKDTYEDILDASSQSTMDRIPVVGDIIKSTTKKQNNRVYVNIPNDYTIYLRK